MIESKPFYWLVCDAQGCKRRYPQEDDDTCAWAEAEHAVDLAQDDGYWTVIDGNHYCDTCTAWCPVCESEMIPKDGSSPCPDCGVSIAVIEIQLPTEEAPK